MTRRLALAAAALFAALPLPLRAQIDPASADRFAKMALACLDREYPNKPDVVLEGAGDVRPPREAHPAFFGCYDWHSSVESHWMLVRLARVAPEMASAAAIRQALDRHLSAEALAAEAKSYEKPGARTFERPYGWAWTLRLAADVAASNDPAERAWKEHLKPLEDAIVARYHDYLPKLTVPVRSGVHQNTAFALAQALDYARATGRKDFEKIILSRASFYYGQDKACPIAYEPSGEDLFSPCLSEADLMRRVLPPREYAAWLKRFLPQIKGHQAFPLSPVTVTDSTDPRLVHFDGLNLSRAWMLKGIAAGLPASDARRPVLLKAAAAHETAGVARVASGDYAGEHWLASFAVYLLTEP